MVLVTINSHAMKIGLRGVLHILVVLVVHFVLIQVLELEATGSETIVRWVDVESF